MKLEKRFFFWGVLGLFAIMLGACMGDEVESLGGANVQVGDVLPDFSLRLNDGRLVESDALNGRVSVLVFFTVGCSDCRQQLPVVDALYKIYRDDPQVTIFAVSRAVPEWEIAPYWKENSFSLPYSAQETRSVYELFASSIVPRIYLSNKHRVVCEVFTDAPLADLQTLTDLVHRLLTEE